MNKRKYLLAILMWFVVTTTWVFIPFFVGSLELLHAAPIWVVVMHLVGAVIIWVVGSVTLVKCAKIITENK